MSNLLDLSSVSTLCCYFWTNSQRSYRPRFVSSGNFSEHLDQAWKTLFLCWAEKKSVKHVFSKTKIKNLKNILVAAVPCRARWPKWQWLRRRSSPSVTSQPWASSARSSAASPASSAAGSCSRCRCCCSRWRWRSLPLPTPRNRQRSNRWMSLPSCRWRSKLTRLFQFARFWLALLSFLRPLPRQSELLFWLVSAIELELIFLFVLENVQSFTFFANYFDVIIKGTVILMLCIERLIYKIV